ncbi:MAG: hypothetical protein A3H88_03230 [Candidatus Blackburnbacteria bacterium RIFCSPLOWO2_02_FULL_44_9]|nr:MAG: hypothetical protein A3H88_03230 [Candidatus Blackburnbacteria bacterium RIFCSPLOWO2_02_FULL_44_9]
MRKSKRFKKLISKAVPLWFFVLALFYSILGTGLFEYYILRKNFDAQILELAKTTKDSDELVQILKEQVLPQKGYQLSIRWNDIGKKLLESGAIDKTKYDELFTNDSFSKEQMGYLSTDSGDHMMINEQNSRFMVNTLWAFGLVNKASVLDDGSIKTYGKGDFMSYASTGGWTLGAKPTREIFSSQELVKLTPEQEEIVRKIAQTIYRPCCGNSAEFPDCNHGMAALGYVEIAVSQGISQEQIYKDLLALNSFWFPQQYVEIAAYMNQQKTEWKDVDPKLILSSQYSSSKGSQSVKQSIQGVPGFSIQGGGCGA